MLKATVELLNVPDGATHVFLTRGFPVAGGMYQCYAYFYKKVGKQVYYYRTDNDNEYPEWVIRDSLPEGAYRIRKK